MEILHYAQKSPEHVLNEFKTSARGLSAKEALLRSKTYGANEVTSHGNGAWQILVRQAKSPFTYLLLAAGVISLVIGETIDSVMIILFVVVNVVIGFFQEFKAQTSIALLKKMIPQQVTVIRDNKTQTVQKKDLVPGDIVKLKAGDIIPAELRVLASENLLIDESVLTGESVPVAKNAEALRRAPKEIFQATNLLFAATSVVTGKAQGVVVTTGNSTQLGNITALTGTQKHEGVYQKNLAYFCKLVLRIVLITMALIFILNFFIKGTHNLLEITLFCVALVVSILPEALPAVVVLALSEGSLKMAKDNVVVKRLPAIEDLGNVEVLCTDKTGTLTQNKLSLEKIISSDKTKTLLYSLLGTQEAMADPFMVALRERASRQTLQQLEHYTIAAELPFDSFRMKSSCLVQSRGQGSMLVVKGAPEMVLKSCTKISGSFDKKELREDMAREGNEGKRVLAIAFKKITKSKVTKEDEKGLTFLGYFVFEDPLKTTAEEAIRLAKKLGVQVKIITGDSKEVAAYVAKKVNLVTSDEKVISGAELAKLVPQEFDEACEDNTVFARISPEIKYKIIKSLQKKYEVGFLGEGINDAPALKIADVGIAVAEASDIAREASDVVLLKKDLRVIIQGIKHGRTIFANINKYIKCALASNFGNFYSIAIISLFVNFLPMLPVQILLGNLLSDFPLISIASDSVDLDELRRPKMYQLHNVLPLIIALALVSTVFDFIFFTIFYHQAPAQIQTLWFVMSILTEIALIFIIRTRGKFWKAKQPNFWLLAFAAIDAAVILALPFLSIGHELFHFVTPQAFPLIIVFVLVGLYFAASEVVKLIYFKYFKLTRTAIDK